MYSSKNHIKLLFGCNTGIKIIEDHFEDHDKYILQRLDSYPPYNSVCKYNTEPAVQEDGNTQREEEERSRAQIRWTKFPWHLRSDEDMKMKRFITHFRQNSLNMKIKGERIYVPNPAEERTCPFCNNNDIDCLEHTLFVCPIIGVSTQQLNQKGWRKDNFMNCLDQTWEDTKEIHGLIMKSLKYRRLIDIEIDHLSHQRKSKEDTGT